jgi:hypothetical protein
MCAVTVCRSVYWRLVVLQHERRRAQRRKLAAQRLRYCGGQPVRVMFDQLRDDERLAAFEVHDGLPRPFEIEPEFCKADAGTDAAVPCHWPCFADADAHRRINGMPRGRLGRSVWHRSTWRSSRFRKAFVRNHIVHARLHRNTPSSQLLDEGRCRPD